MVELQRAKRHLRVVRFVAKVILGPPLSPDFCTPVYNFTPPHNPGRSAFSQGSWRTRVVFRTRIPIVEIVSPARRAEARGWPAHAPRITTVVTNHREAADA